MNLKERGLTVGDLLLILIFITLTIFVFNKLKDNDKQAYFDTPNIIKTFQKY